MDVRSIKDSHLFFVPLQRENLDIFIKIELLKIAVGSLREYHRSLAELKHLADQDDKSKQEELSSDKREKALHISQQMALQIPPPPLWTAV